MKTTRNLVSSTTELTTGMKNCEYYLYGRYSLLRMNTYWYSSTIIKYSYSIIRVYCYFNVCTIACKCLIYSIVHDFINTMMKTSNRGRTNIHTRANSYSLKTLKYLYLIFIVILLCHFYSSNWASRNLKCISRHLVIENTPNLKVEKLNIL